MDSEEQEIFYFLKTWGEEFVNAKEIARRAGGKKKFHENPDWAKPLLMRMRNAAFWKTTRRGATASSRWPKK